MVVKWIKTGADRAGEEPPNPSLKLHLILIILSFLEPTSPCDVGSTRLLVWSTRLKKSEIKDHRVCRREEAERHKTSAWALYLQQRLLCAHDNVYLQESLRVGLLVWVRACVRTCTSI